MNERIESLQAELDEIGAILDKRRQAQRTAIKEIEGKKMSPAEAEEYLARRMEELAPDDGEAVDEQRLDGLLDQVADVYIDEGPRERAALLEMFAERPLLRHELFGYIHRCAAELVQSREMRRLLRGLAAATIEDATTDWRDTRVALAALYQAALKSRMKPEPVFKRMAAIAGNEADGHMSMRGMLDTFDRRACLAAMPRQPGR